jgi:uncharacterized protein YndB with AHSA1/START domain
MTTTATDQAIRTLDFTKDQRIEAPIDVVFETILEEIGPGNELPGHPMPMKLEPWPGGRWFRDLGENAGHFWGHIQVIKPPTLLEITGPMFMSYAATGHVAYRLKSEGNATLLTLRHRAFGMIPEETLTGVRGGWSQHLERIAKSAAKRK